MAPEQARGLKQIDVRTDLYSVGTLMFECLTGRVPFEGDNFNDLMFKIVLAPRPNPCEVNPGIDPGLGAIVTKALSCDPQDRYQNATEMRDAIVAWLDAKGLPSVHPPQLKRVTRTTPRTGEPRMSTPGGARHGMTPPTTPDVAHWSGETLRVESGTETPLASSSATPQLTPQPHTPNRRTSPAVLWGIAVGVVLLGTGGLVASRALMHGASVRAAAASNPADVPPEPRQVLPEPDRLAAPPVATQPAEVPSAVLEQPAVLPAAPSERTTTTNAGRTGAPSRSGPSAKQPVAVAAVPPSASATPKPSDAPPPAPPPPPPPTTTASKAAVEGREIRTGL